MNILPFTMSADAAAWIAARLAPPERESELVGLTPCLGYKLNEQLRDEQGRLFEYCAQPFFDVVWYPRDYVIACGFVSTQILGRSLFVLPDTLEQLKGKQLDLVAAEVGYPTPAKRTRQILRIIDQPLQSELLSPIRSRER